MEGAVWGVLVQAGVPGIILGWFMWRAEVRLDRLTAALDRMNRTQLLHLMARPDVEEPVKKQAREILGECGPMPARQMAEAGT